MKTIVSIVVVVLLLGLGYWYYSSPAPASNELLTTSTDTATGIGDAEAAVVGKKIVSLLSSLQKISIDQSVFATQSFQSLKDFGVEIRPELIGRHDPFAPIGVENGTAPAEVSAPTPLPGGASSVLLR